MIVPTFGTQTAREMAMRQWNAGQQARANAMDLKLMQLSQQRRQIDQIIAMIIQKRQEREQRRAARGSSDSGALTGAGIGGVLGAALAIPTGGLSLAAVPAMAAAGSAGAGVGSTIGGLFDESPAQGMRMGQSLMNLGYRGLGMMNQAQQLGLMSPVRTIPNPLYMGG